MQDVVKIDNSKKKKIHAHTKKSLQLNGML